MGDFVIKLPDVGEGVAEAELVEWLVSVGDVVTEDQPLGAVMTDKANVEIPSPVNGTVKALGADIGDTIAVGAVLLQLSVEGAGNVDDVSAPAEPLDEPSSETIEKPKTSEPDKGCTRHENNANEAVEINTNVPQPVGSVITQFRKDGDRPLAAPSVRRSALERGIDLRLVPGSGPIGQITHADLDAHNKSGATNARGLKRIPHLDVKEVKVVGLRRKIAERMQQAMTDIPHITIVEEIDVTQLESLRTNLNAKKREEQSKLTLLPFLMRAIVKGVSAYPEINALFDKDANVLKQHKGVHIGIATQTDRGLIVPVVRHCEARSIWSNAAEVARVSSAARDGSADRSELSGSTITISSLGPLGGLATTPIINAPEMAIVGVNKMRTQPVWQNGNFVPRKVLNLSCSFDHRFIDGWEAAQFIQVLKSLIESPAELFMELGDD